MILHCRPGALELLLTKQVDEIFIATLERDLALAVLSEARLPGFESVFIDDDAALEMLYGTRVPVLRDDAHGTELDWPFDAVAVAGLFGPSDQSQNLRE